MCYGNYERVNGTLLKRIYVATTVVVSILLPGSAVIWYIVLGVVVEWGVFVVVNSGNKKDLSFTSKTLELEGRKIPRRGMCVHG